MQNLEVNIDPHRTALIQVEINNLLDNFERKFVNTKPTASDRKKLIDDIRGILEKDAANNKVSISEC